MRFWQIVLIFALAGACFAAEPQAVKIRGKLLQQAGKPPAIQTADQKLIFLDGDDATKGVLNDKRLAGFDLEARGHFTAPDRFLVEHIHTKALFVYKDGHPKLITYWCDVCAIRTYTPGICVCCQDYTTLDLRDPDEQ